MIVVIIIMMMMMILVIMMIIMMMMMMITSIHISQIFLETQIRMQCLESFLTQSLKSTIEGSSQQTSISLT